MVTIKEDSMKRLSIVRDPVYLEHKTGEFHPESHHRLEVLYRLLDQVEIKKLYGTLEPRKATRAEIEYIHSPAYFKKAEATAGKSVTYLDPDTVASAGTFKAALYAAGGVLAGIDSLFSGAADSVLALIRPPGHHAEHDGGMGFCIFNNVAVGAVYAMKQHTIERVLIVDWDLHHGNGTQHAFYADPRVLYFSTHQYPYYPGSGAADEVGQGAGEGFTVNVPLAPGMGDNEYLTIFRNILTPIADRYRPQLVIVSAGFDTYRDDPLGGMELTSSGYATLTEIVKTIAEMHAEGRLLVALEGGYDLRGLQESVKSVIHTLISETKSGLPVYDREKDNGSYIENVLAVQRRFWDCF